MNTMRRKLERPKSTKLKETIYSKVRNTTFFRNIFLIGFYIIDSKFDQALDAYSEAIFCNVPQKNKAIYYCNRALVSIRQENYALALYDAKDAIKCDPEYVKAYYR
jgi:tetratricopeptide (TPR) repeat protein